MKILLPWRFPQVKVWICWKLGAGADRASGVIEV